MHSAQAKSISGRDGRSESTDHVCNLGGRAWEGATSPEQLFAAGYAACFGNAVIHIARQDQVNAGEISIDAQVDLAMSEESLPTLSVALPGVGQAWAEETVTKAHETCPYSRATRGNIAVNVWFAPASARRRLPAGR